ncbi:hypothetical protein [Streptomyces sp. NPDC004285]
MDGLAGVVDEPCLDLVPARAEGLFVRGVEQIGDLLGARAAVGADGVDGVLAVFRAIGPGRVPPRFRRGGRGMTGMVSVPRLPRAGRR